MSAFADGPESVDEVVLMIDHTVTATATPLETFSLPVETAAPASSTMSLAAGKAYVVEVSGTADIGDGTWYGDAEYYTNNNWSTQIDVDGNGLDRGVTIDGADIAWGPYNGSHVYQTIVIGDGTPIDLAYIDGNYANNATDSLTVKIRDTAEQEVWAHADRLGSTVATSDSVGNAIDTYTYSKYGEPGASEGGFPFRFTGQKLDAVTGLYNYKNRWYDPETGRFLQTDPIGYGDGMNMYAYVGNDPVNGSDPSGTVGNNGGAENLNQTKDVIVVEGTRLSWPTWATNLLQQWLIQGGLTPGVGYDPIGGAGGTVSTGAADAAKEDIDNSLCGNGGTGVSSLDAAAQLILPYASTALQQQLTQALGQALDGSRSFYNHYNNPYFRAPTNMFSEDDVGAQITTTARRRYGILVGTGFAVSDAGVGPPDGFTGGNGLQPLRPAPDLIVATVVWVHHGGNARSRPYANEKHFAIRIAEQNFFNQAVTRTGAPVVAGTPFGTCVFGAN